MDAQNVESATRAWVREVIVGWGLCPFARGLQADDRLRVVVTDAENAQDLLTALAGEALRLVDADPRALETTLLVHPKVLTRFEAQLDFMPAAEAMLEQLGVDSELQVVSFHPDHLFGDASQPAEHFANRSPFACLHLLRRASVAAAVAGHKDICVISRDNVAHLCGRGEAQLEQDFARLRALASAGLASDDETR